MDVRVARADEVDVLARLWYDAWQDSHARILPAQLVRHRTPASFRERLLAALADVRVVDADGEPAGLAIARDDELYQLFVSARARGTGVAAALLDDAEARIAAAGHARAWLACAIGNARAARFYEKHGWRFAGEMASPLPTPDGAFRLEVWRYEKALAFRTGRPGRT